MNLEDKLNAFEGALAEAFDLGDPWGGNHGQAVIREYRRTVEKAAADRIRNAWLAWIPSGRKNTHSYTECRDGAHYSKEKHLRLTWNDAANWIDPDVNDDST